MDTHPNNNGKRLVTNLAQLEEATKYLRRVGAKAKGIRKAEVYSEDDKYPKLLVTITLYPERVDDTDKRLMEARLSFGVTGIDLSDYLPNEDEERAIRAELRGCTFPASAPSHGSFVPEELRKLPKDNVFIFRTPDNKATSFIQQRIDKEDGAKEYVPWSYWSDGKWRCHEPDGLLPVWGLDQFSGADTDTLFIHEGAKAARLVRDMVAPTDGHGKLIDDPKQYKSTDMRKLFEEHPWAVELSAAIHIGWVGGAGNASKTDWPALVREMTRVGITKVIIVQDNDEKGKESTRFISRQLRCMTAALTFGDGFPTGFDLADPWPAMHNRLPDRKNSTDFESYLSPATWATDRVTVEGDDGRLSVVEALRSCLKHSWTYVQELDEVFCVWPRAPWGTCRKKDQFNSTVRPFSGSKNTFDLLMREGVTPILSYTYQPGNQGLVVRNHAGKLCINLWRRSNVKAKSGNVETFMKYLEWLIPDEGDRTKVLRWIATLVGKPERRIRYALLLMSTTEGTGKTTLVEFLRRLVGWYNTKSVPESAIVDSNFNSWCLNTTLVEVPEIYQGSTWKAANKLKQFISDDHMHVNEKFRPEYDTQIHCHFVACSNSKKALKLKNDDRRWLVPGVTEELWPPESFAALRRWFYQEGGAGALLHWARTFGDYIAEGERAPMTTEKSELIEASKDEVTRDMDAIVERMTECEDAMIVLLSEVVSKLQIACRDRKEGWFLSPREVKSYLVRAGLRSCKEQYSHKNSKHLLIGNRAAAELVSAADTRKETDVAVWEVTRQRIDNTIEASRQILEQPM